MESGVEEAAGEQGALDGPGGSAGVDHLLDAFEQVGEVHVGAAVLEPEAGGVLAAVGVAPGDGEVFHGAAGHEDAGAEAVDVVDDVERRIWGRWFRFWCRAGSGFSWKRVTAASSSFAVEEFLFGGLPDGVAGEAADGFDAGFAASSLFGRGIGPFRGRGSRRRRGGRSRWRRFPSAVGRGRCRLRDCARSSAATSRP